MLDIENVNGIIIAPDGSFRKFGTYKDVPLKEMTDDNFHDTSFKKDVSKSEWFKELQKNLDFEYTDDTIHRQAAEWASDGVVLLFHGGVGEGEIYCAYAPSECSLEQKKLFKDNYDNLEEQINRNDVYFQASIFDENGNYDDDGLIFGLDNFYSMMHITKRKVDKKVR